MPKVVYSDSKGLVQETGSGFSFVTGTVADKVGLHLYQEEVELSTVVADKIAGLLSKKLPANSIILQTSLTTSSAGASGLIELRYHTSLPSINAGISGTLIMGTETNQCVPDADLDVSVDGQTIVCLTPRDVTNKQFLFLTSNVGANVAGSPKVLVSILYAGKGEPEVI